MFNCIESRIPAELVQSLVWDGEGNARKMIAGAQQAAMEGSELVGFSELSLTGCYPRDLLDGTLFMTRVAEGLVTLQQVSRQLHGLHWIVGAPVPCDGPGKRLQNALVMLKAGEVVVRYAKQPLPTYNIVRALAGNN